MKQTTLTHEFVDYIPESLREGQLYISLRFATALHKCVCGCGGEVVTPLSPRDWKLIFDGETVSLEPSIGNWSFRCRSHYWIRRGKVVWASRWSKRDIQSARAEERTQYDEYFGVGEFGPSTEQKRQTRKPGNGLWQRIRGWRDGK
jgi:hypothetical protein